MKIKCYKTDAYLNIDFLLKKETELLDALSDIFSKDGDSLVELSMKGDDYILSIKRARDSKYI